MGTMKQVRDGLKTRLQTISGLRVYDVLEGPVSTPAAVIWPDDGDYHDSMSSQGRLTLRMIVKLFVQATSLRSGQDELDDLLLSSSGDVRDAIEGDKTLGGVADNVVVDGWDSYGLDEGEGGPLSAVVRVRVITTKE